MSCEAMLNFSFLNLAFSENNFLANLGPHSKVKSFDSLDSSNIFLSIFLMNVFFIMSALCI